MIVAIAEQNVSWLFDQGADTTFDGDGRPAKRIDKHRSYDDEGDGFVQETKYRIYSSVTGAEITELNGTGEKAKTSVYLHGKVIAEQKFEAETEIVSFKFGDPLDGRDADTAVRTNGRCSAAERVREIKKLATDFHG